MLNYNGDLFRDDRVSAESVGDFIDRYYKPDRLQDFPGDMEGERRQRLINNYTRELESCGYCFISRHDSITGRVVSFFGPDEPR
jgi:hypothetical protein